VKKSSLFNFTFRISTSLFSIVIPPIEFHSIYPCKLNKVTLTYFRLCVPLLRITAYISGGLLPYKHAEHQAIFRLGYFFCSVLRLEVERCKTIFEQVRLAAAVSGRSCRKGRNPWVEILVFKGYLERFVKLDSVSLLALCTLFVWSRGFYRELMIQIRVITCLLGL